MNNCYFQEGTAAKGIGEGSSGTNVTSKPADAFASGEVAYLLQAGQTAGEDGSTPQVWGQALGTNGDATPVLTGDEDLSVVKVTFMVKDEGGYTEYDAKYTNKDGTVGLPEEPTSGTYAFVKWSKSADANGEEFTDKTEVTDSITVYAVGDRKSVV